MLLGGSRYALPVIRAAHELGIHVITVDYLPDNIAHRYSDEYCNISIVEKEAVLKAAKELQVDGIMSFACDPGVVTAAYVAEKLGLPSCGPYDSVCILQNKGRFRKFLAEHGFRVPTAKSYHGMEEALKDTALFHWPVIVKPTDSAGSKGVTKVERPEDLKESISHALSFSRGNEFIIEDFITQKGYSSDTDSFSVDGKLEFVSFNSQRFDNRAENPYTPAAYSWPSSISAAHQQELASELQRLLTLLGMRTSLYNIETRESTDGKAYIMECSPRGGGNRLAECLEYATGVRLIENAVRAAVGLPTLSLTHEPITGYWAEIILHGYENGVFRQLRVLDEIQQWVVDCDLWINEGDRIESFSAANKAVGTLILHIDSLEKMQRVLSNVNDYVRVVVDPE